MKFRTIISLLFITAAFGSCDVIGPCENIESKQVMFLLDVTDSTLFENSKFDITSNFSSFMKRNQLALISECERFTFSVGHLSGLESLEINSSSIEIPSKGESFKKQQSLSNPSGIGQLVKNKLSEYTSLTADESYTSGSFLANQIFRAANEMEQDGTNSIFIFSDLIENNKHLNMYKNQFDFSEYPDIINDIIEPSVLSQFKSDQKAGKLVKIILVQKDEPNGKVDRRKIKEFWIQLMTELRVDFQIIDNLSQNVTI